MVNLEEKTKSHFSKEKEKISGVISFGCDELLSMSYLASIMTAFQKENPEIKYDIYSGDADNTKELIQRGLLDFGLLLEPVDIAQYQFIKQGAGASISLQLDRNYDGITCVPLSPAIKLNSVLAWKRDQPTSKAVQAFLEFAKTF